MSQRYSAPRVPGARRLACSGATLVELVLSIAIVGVAMAGLMAVVSGLIGRSSDPMIEHQAQAIAQAYLEEEGFHLDLER